MCTSCVTTAEAAVIAAAAGLSMAKGAADRLADALAGRHPAERRQEAWDANAAFVGSMGLDPLAVLGPRPTVPASCTVPERSDLGVVAG
jgi:hypothetical protein